MSKIRIEALRQRVLDLRRVSTLPWWRTSYADFLLERAGEYVAVAREPEAEGVLDRVQRWIEQQEAQLRIHHAATGSASVTHKVRVFGLAQISQKLAELRADLVTRRQLIPGPEREALVTRLDRVERHLQANRLDEAHAELNTVRVAWIRRLTRSYRAWSPVAVPSTGSRVLGSANPRLGLVPTGPYNNRRNLDELVTLVGERDPIWVEDFVELYNDLMQYMDRLGDTDKKKPRK
jgi:uncharacterized membrane protein YccC